MRVMRSDLDGANVETLVRNGDVENLEHRKDYLRWCVSIQVDEEVHWTEKRPPKGGKGNMLRCSTDGADVGGDGIEVLFEKLPAPIDLALDLENGRLYCTDRGDIPLGNIVSRERIPKTGERTAHEVLIWKLQEGIGLELDVKNKALYITDLLGGVFQANLDGSDEKVLFPDLGTVTGIAIARLN